MIVVLTWYALFLLFLGAVATIVYRGLRPRMGRWAMAASALAILLGGLLAPMPIHGGFTTPMAILWEEWGDLRWDREPEKSRQWSAALVAELKARFAGPLPFRRGAAHDGWIAVAGDGFTSGWYEPNSALIWSDPLPWPAAPTTPSLAEARSFCGQLQPAGYWALPSEAELYYFWRAGGGRITPWLGHDRVAQLLDRSAGLTIATYHRGSAPGFAVRCVARAAGSPETGYTSEDIPPADWNAYQLAKASGY